MICEVRQKLTGYLDLDLPACASYEIKEITYYISDVSPLFLS